MKSSRACPGGSSENKPTCSIPNEYGHVGFFRFASGSNPSPGCEKTISVICIETSDSQERQFAMKNRMFGGIGVMALAFIVPRRAKRSPMTST